LMKMSSSAFPNISPFVKNTEQMKKKILGVNVLFL
jgi:hypothetical protein